ncbi:MAG: hypothetical protein ACK47S_09745 [Paracoccaceae bacterium]
MSTGVPLDWASACEKTGISAAVIARFASNRATIPLFSHAQFVRLLTDFLTRREDSEKPSKSAGRKTLILVLNSGCGDRLWLTPNNNGTSGFASLA